MSRYGGKSYGRRAVDCKTNMKFDQLLSENTNKPSTAKVSVAGGQRWGMASFTSIRKTHINGRKDNSSLHEDESNKRMKMVDNEVDPFSFDCDGSPVKQTKTSTASYSESEPIPKPPPTSRPNKFFKSGVTRPLAVQNTMNKKKPVTGANSITEKANSNTFALKQLTLDQFAKPVTKTPEVPITYNYPKPQPILDDQPQVLKPSLVTNRPMSNDPFDLLLNSIPAAPKNELQSFSVERILGDDKFSTSSHTSSNDNFYSTPVTQNDIFSLPTSQLSQTLENDIFGSQSSVQSHFSSGYGMESADVHYPSVQPQPGAAATTYDNVIFSASQHLSSQNKWSNWTSDNHSEGQVSTPPVQPVSIVQSQIFNPAFRTYTRSKDRDAVVSQSSVVPINSFSSEATASNDSPNQSEALVSSGNSINVISDTRGDSLYPSTEQSDTAISSLPLSQATNISDSLCSVLSDSVPTDCSQESKESSQPDDLKDYLNQAGPSEQLKRNQKSLFKSRKIFNSPKKMKAVYKYRPWHVDDDKDKEEAEMKMDEKQSLADEFEEDEEDDDMHVTQKLTLSKFVKKTTHHGEVITSWKCQRSVKELYTVVHNVKQAHQCHESGETQEFNDDVEYLLEGIQTSSSLGTRCLSTLSWATKCMGASFRIHLRAHGTLSRVFSALMDAPSDPSLSLSTATLMFVLSQDRLTMDLEASTLSLLLQLLECNAGDSVQSSIASSQSINPQQIIEKVRSLCEEMQQKGYAKQLDLNNTTAGILAMETLLSLSSRRTGEWFKEEIRTLGGLDYIVDTVHTGIKQWSEAVSDFSALPNELDQLRKLDRCLRVVENVTYMNQDNQAHVLTFKNADLVDSCLNLLQLCRTKIIHFPVDQNDENPRLKGSTAPGAVLFSTIKTLLKVLINITHENSLGSAIVGSQESIMECILLLFLQTGACIPPEERFDLLVLSFALLINFVEFCPENRDKLILVRVVGSFDCPSSGEEMSCIEALIEVFVNRLDLAKQSEDQASALLDGQAEENSAKHLEGGASTNSSSQVISQQAQVEQLEETLMKALHKAGKNMEHTIIAAYISLLVGCVIQNPDYRGIVQDQMPDESFTPMIEVLRKFLNFVNLTGVVSNAGVKSIQRVLGVLETS